MVKIKYCKCGCGLSISQSWEFVHGHNRRGVPSPIKGVPRTDETKRKISTAKKGGLSGWEGKHHSEATKIKLSILKTGRIVSKETREKLSLINIGKRHSKETRKKISLISKNNWLKPGYAEKIHNKESKRKISIATIKLWNSLDYIEKQNISRQILPNKPEKKIMVLLDCLYPGEWKYTGDFSFLIGGKNPDFVNINGQKKCIEHYGTYWHKGDNPQDRIDLFKSYGWDCLVIWESELKDFKSLRRKIFNFSEGTQCSKT